VKRKLTITTSTGAPRPAGTERDGTEILRRLLAKILEGKK
jgi:hypothetical protein